MHTRTLFLALAMASLVMPTWAGAQQGERELEGGIDLHMHADPAASSRGRRSVNVFEAAEIARIVVIHPASGAVGMSLELQKEAASLGTLLEYTILSVAGGRGSLDDFATQIREVGPKNVVITSDLGQ